VSTEQVLLLIAFLVLPLLQPLLRASRQGQAREPANADDQPPSPGPPPLPELLPPPVMEDRALSHASNTPELKPAFDADRPVAAPIRRSPRRAKTAVGLRDPLDLRRAIVFMTVIEPCRAIRPYD
jgi:hypothetical protein